MVKKVRIEDIIKKAEEFLFFEEERKGILFLLERELEYFLKNYNWEGFKELKENLQKRKEIALENKDQKMLKVYSIMLYLVNNLEDYYFSRLFEKFFDLD